MLLIRRGGIDWPRLAADAARRRFALRTGAMLAYLRTAFDAPIPEAALEAWRTLPVSRFERFEYRVGNRPQGVLGELPSYWCNYRRLHGGARVPPLLGFLRYLQQTWHVDSLGRVLRGATARAATRARIALLRRPAPGRPAP
jgi:hypothetical protein